MTPGHARIALLSFLIVTTGVAANAFLLQPKPAGVTSAAPAQPRPPAAARQRKSSEAALTEPADHRWTGDTPGQLLRITRFAPDTGPSEAAADDAQLAASAGTIAAIQRELAARGYGPLAGDGLMGLATRAGIMAFEHDNGLPLTGEASEDLLKRILLGSSTTAPSDATAARVSLGARTAQAAQVIRKVQQGLVALRYPIARVDGRLGEDTVKAIRDFEVDRGLVPRGRISAELVAQLGDSTPRTRSAR